MFTQSFENSERQRQRRQQRELALRRMEEAAGGGDASAPSSVMRSATAAMTSADYASDFLRRHHNEIGVNIGGGGSIGKGNNDVRGRVENLHNIKRSFHVDKAEKEPKENHNFTNNYQDDENDDENDYNDDEDEDEDGEYDEDDSSMMLHRADRENRRIHYLDREGNMTNHDVVSTTITKRTWRRPIISSWMAVCTVVAIVTIIIIISVLVSVVLGLNDSKPGSASNNTVIDNSNNAQFDPWDVGNDKGVVSPVIAHEQPLSPKGQERFDNICKTILQQNISTSQTLSDTRSPQYAAVQWLTRENDDELQQIMDVKTGAHLLQRYGLAVLWFSTTRSEYQWHMTQEVNSAVSEEVNEVEYETKKYIDDDTGSMNEMEDDREDRRQHRKLTGTITDPNVWFRHNNWLSSSDVCTWEGIVCHTHKEEEEDDNKYDTTNSGIVASIELRRNNVQGLLPEELYLTLPSLKVLDLSDNGIAGTMSSKISIWTDLEHLNFTSNNLGGSLSPQIGKLSSLREMHLAENQLEHSIPHTIGNMSRLKHVDLSGNSLRGTIPFELGNLEELSTLDLSWNALAGPLPHELSKMQTLVKLDVCHNNLVGPLLLELSDVRYLTVLKLNDNHLSGEIPSDIGTLVHLEELSLNNNNFRGFLPSEISNLVGLGKQLSMRSAQFYYLKQH